MTKKKLWIIPVAVLVVLILVFIIYVSGYSRADASAESALRSDSVVTVTETDYGWLFDGPSEDTALVFYPGGKVDTVAYAPLLHRLAGEGMDVCLVDMPFHLAIFGIGKAGPVMEEYSYDRWYIGGHSLGGAMAASWASEHGELLSGVVLLAAYPTKPLDESLAEILIYGYEDQVVDPEKYREGEQYAPDDLTEHVIRGGNHAQFGNYGSQKGDGTALITAEAQQAETVDVIIGAVHSVE